MKFSTIFSLPAQQSQLDFIDVSAGMDLQLFIDPYAICQQNDTWSQNAANYIRGYFEKVVGSIRRGASDEALELLQHLGENNETHLGMSKQEPRGKGVGAKQSKQLYDSLFNSDAAKSGLLVDLSDCDLFIKGIGRDKISDITTNVIKKLLAEYTTTQCALWGVPVSHCQLGASWNQAKQEWENMYFNLPIHDSKRFLLVPKAIARYTTDINPTTYYNSYVLDFLRTTELTAGGSLVKLLKNGKRKVHSKDLKRKYPNSKQFLASFSKKHPDILRKYKLDQARQSKPLQNDRIDPNSVPAIEARNLAKQLKAISTGPQDADKYHKAMIGILEAILYPDLTMPQCEFPINDGRKRIDIVYYNAATDGFFREFRIDHPPCPFVHVECKNYTSDLRNPEYDQLTGRFSRDRGTLGILCCRENSDKPKALKTCGDLVKAGRGFVIVLEDSDIEKLLDAYGRNNRKDISDVFREKLIEILK